MRRPILPLLFLLTAWGAAALPRVSAQDQVRQRPPIEKPDEIQLSSNLVTATVVVRDASGSLVTDLSAGDFRVFENGKEQQVDQVYRQGEVPLRLALLFDVSLSVKSRIDFECRAASKFFADALKPKDRAALVSVSTDWRLEQPLTESTAALTAALGRLKVDGITALYGAIAGAARHLESVEGRRVIVVLSDGYDTAATETLEEALEAAHKADAVLYAISPAGAGEDPTSAGRIGAAALRKLCSETGGRAFFPPVQRKLDLEAKDLDGIYQTVVEELRSQYVLTYYSATAGSDGAFRALRVDVRRSGLVVSARKGYFAK